MSTNFIKGLKEEEEEKFKMGDSLTANPMTPYTSESSFASASQFEDNPQRTQSIQDDYENSDSYSTSGSEGDEYEDDNDDDEEPPLSLDELLYSASSFHAIVRPVSATMILAALASVYINTEASRELGEQQFASAYNVWHVDNSGGGNVGKNLLASVGNTFVMVSVIGTMTFGIVLLYKYR